MYRGILSAVIGVLCCASFAAPAQRPSEEEQKDAQRSQRSARVSAERSEEQKDAAFVRLVRDRHRSPQAMETAIVRHVPRDCSRTSPTVDLVSAVHIADRSYYEELNRRFRDYDVVLYELVAPEGTVVPRGGGEGSGHPVALLQQAMTGVLKLEHQLRVVDYTRANFVHADMTPDEFTEAMRQRGESLFQLFVRMMGYAIGRQNAGAGVPSDAALLMALFDKDRAVALKRVMAEQFEDLDGSLAAINGPEGSTLITGRNKKALEVLRVQINKDRKNIAIFYGAGHMPDLQERLRDQFDLVPIGTEWLTAWDMRGKGGEPP